jgi:hypothetical protein
MKLVTLSELKTFLKINSSDTTFDALLDQINDKASGFILNYVNRESFEAVQYEEIYSGEGENELQLDNYPIISLDAFSLDFDLVEKVINETIDVKYLLPNEAIGLIAYISNIFPEGTHNIYIKYTAGFSAVPDGVKHIILNICSKKFYESDQKRFGKTSKTVGGETVSFSLDELTDTDKAALDIYRKIPRKEAFNITIP